MSVTDDAATASLASVKPPEDNDFQLPSEGLDDSKRKATLDKLEKYFSARRDKFLGYQVNEGFDYQTDAARFLNYHSNNVGDPFEDSHFTLHTRGAERAVLDYYARLWHAKPREKDHGGKFTHPDAYWGYVLTMGSSEGNNYAFWNARDYLSGKTLMREPSSRDNATAAHYMWVRDTPPTDNQNAYSPVCFYSRDTHYSVAKALRVLNIPTFFEVGTKCYPYANPLTSKKARDEGRWEPWPHEVPSEGDDAGPGSIDIDKLVTLVEFFASMGHPILINLNYGSTFKCAYDNVGLICEKLRPIFHKYGLDERKVRYGRDQQGKELVDTRTGYWIHVDGALGATYAPFLEKAIEAKKVSLPKNGGGQDIPLPMFDFRIPEVCSIVTSGHKYPGASWPCGVFMTKSNLQMQPPEQPAVIGSPDTTFGGSRNAFSPLLMWDFLAKHSEATQIDMVVKAVKITDYAERKLKELDTNNKWAVARSPLALCVRFRKPPEHIVSKYSLATIPLRTIEGNQVDYAHLYVMPHVTERLIDELVHDLQNAIPAESQHELGGIDLWSYSDGVADPADVMRLALVRTWGNGF